MTTLCIHVLLTRGCFFTCAWYHWGRGSACSSELTCPCDMVLGMFLVKAVRIEGFCWPIAPCMGFLGFYALNCNILSFHLMLRTLVVFAI